MVIHFYYLKISTTIANFKIYIKKLFI